MSVSSFFLRILTVADICVGLHKTVPVTVYKSWNTAQPSSTSDMEGVLGTSDSSDSNIGFKDLNASDKPAAHNSMPNHSNVSAFPALTSIFSTQTLSVFPRC